MPSSSTTVEPELKTPQETVITCTNVEELEHSHVSIEAVTEDSSSPDQVEEIVEETRTDKNTVVPTEMGDNLLPNQIDPLAINSSESETITTEEVNNTSVVSGFHNVFLILSN